MFSHLCCLVHLNRTGSFSLTVLLVCADKITVKALGGESKQH